MYVKIGNQILVYVHVYTILIELVPAINVVYNYVAMLCKSGVLPFVFEAAVSQYTPVNCGVQAQWNISWLPPSIVVVHVPPLIQGEGRQASVSHNAS